jgi:hypothetical protein
MKTIEEFYKEWENDKHYMGDEDSWAIWFAEDWEKYKQEQCNIADVVGRITVTLSVWQVSHAPNLKIKQ